MTCLDQKNIPQHLEINVVFFNTFLNYRTYIFCNLEKNIPIMFMIKLKNCFQVVVKRNNQFIPKICQNELRYLKNNHFNFLQILSFSTLFLDGDIKVHDLYCTVWLLSRNKIQHSNYIHLIFVIHLLSTHSHSNIPWYFLWFLSSYQMQHIWPKQSSQQHQNWRKATQPCTVDLWVMWQMRSWLRFYHRQVGIWHTEYHMITCEHFW